VSRHLDLDLAWPEPTLGQALAELARAARLPCLSRETGPLTDRAGPDRIDSPPYGAAEDLVLGHAERLGLTARSVDAGYADLDQLLARMAPAIVPLERDGERRYLAVLRSSRRQLWVLDPELRVASVAIATVRAALTGQLDGLPLARIDAWLEQSGVSERRARRARPALLDLLYGERRVGPVWLLQADPGSAFLGQLRDTGAVGRAAAAVLLSVAQVAVSLLGWLLLGRVALGGSIEPAWLCAWGLCLLSALPFQIAAAKVGSSVLQTLAEALKRRLLCGTLRLPADRIRQRGSGRLLAMAAECEALESAGLGGAFSALNAVPLLVAATLVLAQGAGGLAHAALVPLWCVGIALVMRRMLAARRSWTAARLTSSCSFVEHVLGNRTRVVQQAPSRWHEREDPELRAELAASTAFDATLLTLSALAARGWLLAGFLGLVPALLDPPPATTLALSVGGLMLAYGAFTALGSALPQLCAAFVSWQTVRELYDAAPAAPRPGHAGLSTARRNRRPGAAPLLHAAGLWFRHHASEPVLRGAGLCLRPGDFVVLDGASGGGKSTLASVLVGLRSAERGHVLLDGLDRASLGDRAWARRIASAPQFHDNHVFSATLAFNLLLGRSWPASEADRRDAEAVCRSLGLGPLLSRMPAGLEQIVGETGWQLSHGERSRLFLARALLQTDAVVVLDESLGALDPETARQVERAITERAQAALVIAHP
jgi:ATP-binding cassette subfamily B protein